MLPATDALRPARQCQEVVAARAAGASSRTSRPSVRGAGTPGISCSAAASVRREPEPGGPGRRLLAAHQPDLAVRRRRPAGHDHGHAVRWPGESQVGDGPGDGLRRPPARRPRPSSGAGRRRRPVARHDPVVVLGPGAQPGIGEPGERAPRPASRRPVPAAGGRRPADQDGAVGAAGAAARRRRPRFRRPSRDTSVTSGVNIAAAWWRAGTTLRPRVRRRRCRTGRAPGGAAGVGRRCCSVRVDHGRALGRRRRGPALAAHHPVLDAPGPAPGWAPR